MAATVTHRGSTFNTTAGNKTVVATPAVGDLIVVIAASSGVATSAITDTQSGTYVKVDTDRTGFSTTGTLNAWVRTALIPAASSTTFTATQTSSTGGGLSVFSISGMSLTGAAAVRSSGGQSTQTAATTPAPVLSLTPLASNPIITAVANGSTTGTAVTPRTGYTEAMETGYSTPAAGLETSFLASGETSATLTFGGTVATAFASLALEIQFNTPPTVTPNSPADTSSVSTTTPQLAFTGTDVDLLVANDVANLGTSASVAWGISGVPALGQIVPNTSTKQINSVTLGLSKTASPTDNLYVEIATTSMSGTTVATSGVIAGSTLTTSQVDYTFTFASPPTVTGTYYVRLLRSGAVDATNFYRWFGTGTLSGWTAQSYNGSTWSSRGANTAFEIIINASMPDSITYEVQVDTVNTFDSQGSIGTPTYVQSKSVRVTSTTTPSITLNSAPTAGNVLVLTYAVGSAGGTPSFAGWTALTRTNSTFTMQMFYKVSDGSETTITGSSASSAATIMAAEYSGIDTTNPLLIDNAQNNASTTTQTTPSVTPTAGVKAIVLFATSTQFAATWSSEQVNGSTTGVVEREDANLSGSAQFSELSVSSTTGSYSASALQSTAASTGCGAIAIFRAANNTSPLLDKLSNTDTGFTDITNGANTDPFPSGEQIGYTTTALTNGVTYYWRARGNDTTGTNTYGAWPTARSFTVSAGTTLTKTQTATARITRTVTKTQSATANIQLPPSKTQTATARISSGVVFGNIATYNTLLTNSTQIVNTAYAELNNTTSGRYYNYRFTYDPSKWDNVTAIYFEASMSVASGTGLIKLFDVTHSADISGSELSSTTSGIFRTADIKAALPSSSSVLTLYINSTVTNGATVTGGRLIVVQGSTATAIEQMIQLGSADFGNATTPTYDAFSDLWLYDGSQYDALTGIYFEMAGGTSTAGNTLTLSLYDVTASSTVTSLTTTGTGINYLRSSDIKGSLTSGHEYAVYYSNSTANNGGWGAVRLIIDQYSFSKTQLVLNPYAGSVSVTTLANWYGGLTFTPSFYNTSNLYTIYPEAVVTPNNTTYTITSRWTDGSGTIYTNSSLTNSTGSTSQVRLRGSTALTFPASNTDIYHGVVGNNSSAGNSSTYRVLINAVVASPKTKTQTAVARISKTLTGTQPSLARISKSITTTQTATARVGVITTKTQSSVARISNTTLTKTQTAIARVSKAFTATQPSIARVSKSFTKTQSSTARVSKSFTLTQPSTARINNTAVTKTQSVVARINNTAVTKSQTAIASIIRSTTKTQSATARVSKALTATQTATGRAQKTFTATETAIARVSKSFTSTEPSTARIRNTATTKTQSATARINNTTITKTQSAIARVSKTFTSTETSIARVSKSFTKTTTSIARINNTAVTKTQGVIARINNTTLTRTQTATARVSNTTLTRTQSSTARVSKTFTATQPTTARISNTAVTKSQTAITRVSKSFTKTETAIARVSKTLTSTETATGRISKLITKTQPAIALIAGNHTMTQTAKARVGNGYLASLASYWKLDDASGTTATDSIGGNDGTWQGTLGSQWGTGKINGDGVFNGTNNYILVGDKANLSFGTGNYTLSAWVKTTATSRQTIINKYLYTGTSVESGYYIDMLAGGNVRTVYETTNTNLRNTDSSILINDGNWHYIVAVRPSTTGNILLYIDGALDAGATSPFNSGTPGNIDNTIPFAIGQTIDASIGVSDWNGQIDEVGIWSRDLTATEITNLYALGRGTSYPFITSTIVKTQPATGRISKSLTKTQPAVARISKTFTKTETAIARINGSPTISLNTIDSTTFTTVSPVLEFTGTDPDGEDIRYNIQVDTSSSFGTVNDTPTYYFDGHTSITDPNSNWTNDANAFDGLITTSATPAAASTTTSGYLYGKGTTAPTSGGTISQVKARLYGVSGLLGKKARAEIYTASLAEQLTSSTTLTSATPNSSTGYGTYVTLTAPSAGWSWTVLNNLETKIYCNDSTGAVYRVEIQVTVGSGSIDSYSESNTDSTYTIGASGTATAGGQTFTGSGIAIGSAKLYLSKTGAPTGNMVATIYATTGTYGTTSTATGAALATSDTIAVSTLSTSLALVSFTFSGANSITLTNGTHYLVAVEYSGGDASNLINIGWDTTTITASGNSARKISGTWGASAVADSPFYVDGVSAALIDKVSGTDAGFANEITGTDTDPFNSGDKIGYTIQSALADGTYYWRARAKDPTGTNIYSAWPTTRSFIVSASSVVTKTQASVARIQKTFTSTQTAVARVSKTISTTQISVGRISKALSTNQPATGRINNTTLTKTQNAIARIRNTATTKTQASTARVTKTISSNQSATARIQKTFTSTQGVIARVSKSFTSTETTIARVSNSGMTKTQSATARISNATLTKTQATTGRISNTVTKTQTAVASVIAGTVLTKTQTATARIRNTATAKTQTSTARISKSLTITQPVTGRIVKAISITQSATGRIRNTAVTKTQSAIARISKTFTSTEPAIARIRNTATVKTQSATGRIVNTESKAQSTSARIVNSQTTTHQAIARISKTLSSTQTALGRVSKSFTKTQGAIANIVVGVITTKTQTATARVVKTISSTQTATARVGVITTKTQGSTARIVNTIFKTLSANGRVQKTFVSTQGAVANILKLFALTQPAISRIRNLGHANQTATARISNAQSTTHTSVARIRNTATTKVQNSTARIRKSLTATQNSIARIAHTESSSQSITARIANTYSRTQSAIGQIKKSFTAAQSATARISKTFTNLQSANGRVSKVFTWTQGATARVSKPLSKTQGAIARVATALSKAQSSTAAIRTTAFKTQPSRATIRKTVSSTQPINALVQRVYSSVTTAIARISHSYALNQPATAYIVLHNQKIQTLIARIIKTATATQSVNARVAHAESKNQTAIARVVKTITLDQTSVATVQVIYNATQPTTATIVNVAISNQLASAQIVNVQSKTQHSLSSIDTPETATQRMKARVQKTFFRNQVTGGYVLSITSVGTEIVLDGQTIITELRNNQQGITINGTDETLSVSLESGTIKVVLHDNDNQV